MINQNQIEQIESCRRELHDLGYNSSDINRIIKNEIGMADIAVLNDEQFDNLIAELKNYIQFARKCKP